MKLDLSEAATAMLDCDGPVLVLGGPGSGKTTLALIKAQRAVPTLQPGQGILFLSFSRAAVRQVQVRCRDILSADDRQRVTVKTYHAFCMDILKAHGRLLSGCPPRILFPGAEVLAKSYFDGDWEVERRRMADEEGTFTFDLFASCAAGLLDRSVCVRELVSDTYPVVILDEFQDTNDAQWDLVKQLAESSRVITLADPDQRIFEYDETVDPRRLDHLRRHVSPEEFDLSSANHRSPDAGILTFADAVLRKRPLPDTSDVRVIGYYPNGFEATAHAAVTWIISALLTLGVEKPTVAVLGRTNAFVAELSALLDREHTYSGRRLSPQDHQVIWNADQTAAAAQVVASIMEWSRHPHTVAISGTLDAIAQYYDQKNAEKPTQSARSAAKRFHSAAECVREAKSTRVQAARALSEAYSGGVSFSGDPAADWLRARDIVAEIATLKDVHTSARFVRRFRARDEIAGRLSEQWLGTGSYDDARGIVRRALDLRQVMSTQVDPDGVELMTLHKSKGKEFDGVVLIEGAHRSKFFDERREQPPFDASRRLLRVGITRARHRVVIVRPHGAVSLAA